MKPIRFSGLNQINVPRIVSPSSTSTSARQAIGLEERETARADLLIVNCDPSRAVVGAPVETRASRAGLELTAVPFGAHPRGRT
jgi:hypothetical protein